MTLTEVAPQPTDTRIIVLQHNEAEGFLAVTYPTLHRHEGSANIVLAHALARASSECALTACRFTTDADIQLPCPAPPIPAQTFWLTVWSHRGRSKPALDMVLSCLDSRFGGYPIFLWTPMQQDLQLPQWLEPRMSKLTAYLHACVAPERVFSVFSTTALTTAFADKWSALTGFQINPEPLYTAFSAICTQQTLSASVSAQQGLARRATMRDVEAAGKLCQEFTNNSEYPLSVAQGAEEARDLINKGLLWLTVIGGEVATICAVSRSSLHVSAITKVYTTPKWRRKGLAQALLKEVVQRLFACGKDSVVLYVGCDNSAQNVYRRAGFLIQNDICLELGFVGANIGHW
ncbi:acyl-CoA N-acyltransferase [Mycena alexandri]|uniref:Acyl-CoA N-acyltransferase n=1 Tax=Mycena alexandri TaxID=1745969 RepID=A0AAD6T704_9AGAR|nr:acyl-CoA N-acyltransferase [Mycena alexandri]